MAEVEIGIGKSGRQAYPLAQISVVPARRTRDPEDVDVSWQLDAFRLALPVIAAPIDAVVSPTTALAIGELGGLAALHLEGLWTRHDDPLPLLEEIAEADPRQCGPRLQEMYREPVRPSLVKARIAELGAGGGVTCAAVSPQHAAELAPAILEAELDVLVIRGGVVSAEHVSKGGEPLNLKRFIRELDIPVVVGDCVSYQAALHLMRTGAVGILVGSSPGAGVLGLSSPLATAIADAAGARGQHLEETGVYVQVIADGPIRGAGDLARAIACGADAVMVGPLLAGASEAPGRGRAWEISAVHPELPRGGAFAVPTVGSLREVLLGPARRGDGRANLIGGLRQAMALCGYANIREFHKVDVVVSPPERRGEFSPPYRPAQR